MFSMSKAYSVSFLIAYNVPQLVSYTFSQEEKKLTSKHVPILENSDHIIIQSKRSPLLWSRSVGNEHFDSLWITTKSIAL